MLPCLAHSRLGKLCSEQLSAATYEAIISLPESGKTQLECSYAYASVHARKAASVAAGVHKSGAGGVVLWAYKCIFLSSSSSLKGAKTSGGAMSSISGFGVPVLAPH